MSSSRGWCVWLRDKAVSAYTSTYTFLDETVSPLKPIVKAIYNSWPIKNVRNGVNRVLSLPSILSYCPQTVAVLAKSAYTNLVGYGLTAIMYYRGVKIAYEDAPDIIDYGIYALESLISMTIMLRLAMRHNINNNMYTACLTRVIANDLTNKLLNDTSNLLATKLWPGFAGRFGLESSLTGKSCQAFQKALHVELEKIFTAAKITKNSFKVLGIEIAKVIRNTLSHGDKTLEHLNLNYFANIIGATIADEFALVFSKDFIRKVTAERQDFDKILSPEYLKTVSSGKDTFLDAIVVQRNASQSQIEKILSTEWVPTVSKKYAADLMQIIMDVRAQTQAFFPVKYIDSCTCSTEKHVHAILSGPLYFGGILTALLIPWFLHEMGSINDSAYFYLKILTFALRVLTVGQGIYEYKIADAGGQCTTHRYRKFPKTDSAVIGLIHVVISEIIARSLHLAMEVDSFFQRDAISSLLMQLLLVVSLADRRPLPDIDETGWDFYKIPRKVMFKLADSLSKFLPSADDSKARDQLAETIKSILGSRGLHCMLGLILDGDNLLPKTETLHEAKALVQSKYKEFVKKYDHPDKKAVQAVKAIEKTDPLEVLLKYPSINLTTRVFKANIDVLLGKLITVQKWAKWGGVLLAFPLPMGIISIAHVPIRLLQAPTFGDTLKTIKIHLMNVRDIKEPDVQTKVKMTLDPTFGNPSLNQPKKSISEFKVQEVHTESKSQLRDAKNEIITSAPVTTIMTSSSTTTTQQHKTKEDQPAEITGTMSSTSCAEEALMSELPKPSEILSSSTQSSTALVTSIIAPTITLTPVVPVPEWKPVVIEDHVQQLIPSKVPDNSKKVTFNRYDDADFLNANEIGRDKKPQVKKRGYFGTLKGFFGFYKDPKNDKSKSNKPSAPVALQNF